MAWHEVTTEDVMSEFTPAERNMLKGIQADTDFLENILDRVIARVRGCVRAGGGEVDATESYTPDQFDGEVIAITRWRWLIAIGAAQSMQTEQRQKAWEEAEKRLDKVADGDLSVEPPTDEEETPVGGTWNSERKLIMRTHPIPTPTDQTGEDTGYANE